MLFIVTYLQQHGIFGKVSFREVGVTTRYFRWWETMLQCSLSTHEYASARVESVLIHDRT